MQFAPQKIVNTVNKQLFKSDLDTQKVFFTVDQNWKLE